jgi:RimJ/RimL family protein N-acetyltransferase
MKIIETERLYLRELILSDKKELTKVLSDAESMRFYPAPFDDEKVENWIHWNIKNYSNYNFGVWAVILKQGDIFIGDCGITMQNIEGQIAPEIGDCGITMQKIEGQIVPEIGYHIIKKYCKNGYATEAAIACKNYAFEKLGFDEVFSLIRDTNIPSMNVAIRNGMLIRGRYTKNCNGEEIPHYIFSAKRPCNNYYLV